MLTYPTVPPSIHNQPRSTKALAHAMERFLKKKLHISLDNVHFLLTLSGGADSLALLCCFLWLREMNIKYNMVLSVAHMDHALRLESECEAEAVRALCRTWKLPLFVHRIDVKARARTRGHGDMCALEENAREARYVWFEECRKSCGAQWIVLGHHVGDLQEDVLMRLVRGAAWPALGGMTAMDPERCLLRPLLMQEPEHLRCALRHAHVSWIEDVSNADTYFFRNSVRHDILPLIHEKKPSFARNISNLWQLSRIDKEHWDVLVTHICKVYDIRCVHKGEEARVYIPSNALEQSDGATRLRLYVHVMKLLVPHAQARADTLFQLDAALTEGRGGTTFQLPNKICVRLKKRALIFLRPLSAC